MKGWPKTVAWWREPETFRAGEDARLAPQMRRLRPWILLGFFALFMLGCLVGRMNPHKEVVTLPAALAFSLAASLLFTYGLPAFQRWRPSGVVLYDRGIMKSGWQTMLPLKKWDRFAWGCEGTYYVLELINAKGARWRFGIPDPALREKILPVLRQNGLIEITSVTTASTKSR